jgi:hypothetical protein
MKPTIVGRDFMLSTIQAPKVEEVATPEAGATEEAATDEKAEEKKEDKAAE